MKINSLIIGKGDVGSAMYEILLSKRKGKETVKAIDIKDEKYEEDYASITACDVMHVCIRYTYDFIETIESYVEVFKPKLVIIHSTVAVGTTDKLENKIRTKDPTRYVVHSPIQGQHDALAKSIMQFEKIIGTDNDTAFALAKKEMNNLKCVRFSSSTASELAKFFSTSYYGICLAWTREMKRIADKFEVPFEEVATQMNTIYNKGYSTLKPNVIRPTLTPPDKTIGGHCVAQNAKLLSKQVRSKFLKLIK